MTTLAKLLARRQRLLERLQENPGPNERDDIERLIAQINTALDLKHRTKAAMVVQTSSRALAHLGVGGKVGIWLLDRAACGPIKKPQTF